MNTQSGFTLIEMVVVVAVISVLLAIATLKFSKLNEKYTVESNIKEIYSILMRARNSAANTNTPNVIVFTPNQLQTGEDTNGDNNIDGASDSMNYPRFNINFSASPVVFDRRGLTNNIQTIRITGFSAEANPIMDCIVISSTRINIGLMTGGTCVQK